MDEESIFLQAVEIESRDAQAAFLDRACAGNPLVRAGVESLLKHHLAAGRFLETPPAELQATVAAGRGDTLSDHLPDRALQLLVPCDKPGCLGRLGTYEVLEVIGRGGMGVVFKAHDPKLNRLVAIKVMNESLASSPHGVRRFLREAQAAAAVKHEHLVTIHAIHDEANTPYLVMEFVEGQSLDRRIEDHQPLNADEVARIGAQIAAGLDAAHQRGLVHRDIKPANILMESGTGRIKITDFGLARALDGGQLTQEGELAGTPQYMSPEQARGEPVDHRSDLFSLGSLLYTLCTGRPAFPAETSLATLRGICDDSPQPIRAVNPRIPGWLDAAIHGLMEKNPNRRPQTAREVVGLLHAPQAPTVGRRRSMLLWAGAVAIAMAGIVVIVNRGGKSTRVEAPNGATVRVTEDGNVEVDLPDVPTRRPDFVDQLVKLNAGFDGQVSPTIVNGEVVELELIVDQVKDISPLKNLSKLRRLSLRGGGGGSGQLADLSPLKGMPLEQLICVQTNVADLTPLTGMPLKLLQVQGTQVKSLEPLRGMSLVDVNVSFTPVTDISPLKGMPLVSFYCDGTRIADLSPLADMPLKTLNWRGYEQSNPRFQQVVKSIVTLESIDGLPTNEFWQTLRTTQND